MSEINNLLEAFKRFGVHLGLERIKKLLSRLGDPQLSFPIIHITGTNGKGSVCAYLSSVLTAAGYRVGRYTSPHLVDWTERICLNEQPIAQEKLAEILIRIQETIGDEQDCPTQFEVLTAAAWLYFAESQVDIGVIEVGLGGRLDATNVCDRPLVTVITSISREHWQQLGSTLAEIAWEKAGILKPGCPAVLGELPPEAERVIKSRLLKLDCPAVWVKPAQKTDSGAIYQNISYPLSLAGEIQLLNSAIAIATLQILQQQGWQITTEQIQQGMSKTQWSARIQWLEWRGHRLLLDGAHNPAAAIVLRQYVDTLNLPVTWVMGMLATKDHNQIFQALLRPQDQLYLVPVPDHTTADTQSLAEIGKEICPELGDCRTFPEIFSALSEAIEQKERLIVVCGSLYLAGYFLANYSLRQ